MAKKSGNKAQAVRDYLKTNPKAKAAEIVEALQQEGHQADASPRLPTSRARSRRCGVLGKSAKAAEAIPTAAPEAVATTKPSRHT